MIEKIIDNCIPCPFADDGEREGVTSPIWTCHAEYDANGWPRVIAHDEGADSPPSWCPLRKSSILIRLERPLKLIP